jgi:cation diffusion facilitator CzcD-associated flavoprotein CzcO
MRPVRAVADHFRNRELADPELRRRATPDYEIGCKRVLITNDWYSTLARPDVELIDEPIERVTAGGVIGADGVERPADAIIYGTGFRSHDFVAPMEVRGRGGRELGEVWAETPGAHLGMAVSGFPNMFVLYGPNTNHGAGSVIYTLECQFNQVVDAAERIRDGRLRWLDVRPQAQAEWQAEIDRRSADTVWINGGCGNWYVDERGRNTNNWVGSWLEYRRRTRRLDPAGYEFVA